MSQVEDAITAFIKDEILYGREETPLDADTSLLEEGLIDSMDLQRLVAFLEEQFGVSVPDDLLMPENFETIRSIGALVSGLHGGS